MVLTCGCIDAATQFAATFLKHRFENRNVMQKSQNNGLTIKTSFRK